MKVLNERKQDRPSDKVLDVGTGSGYAAAQLDELIWLDESAAVTPLEEPGGEEGAPDTFPSGV